MWKQGKTYLIELQVHEHAYELTLPIRMLNIMT